MTKSTVSRTGDTIDTSIPAGAVSLESILCTEELRRRPSRPPDYEKENRALVALAHALADSPRTILQRLADTILEVCESDSAGISLLTTDDGGKRFYWPAIAGKWKPHVGGGTPRDFGPCGDVLDRNTPLLFTHPERRYSYLQPATPPVEECLLVPFYVEGKAVGTIWAIAHDDLRKFDAEDERLMSSLGRFASSAYQILASLDALKFQAVEREKAEAALRRSEQGLAAELAATQALQEVSSQMIQEDDRGALYEKILDAAVAIMRSHMASMQIVDEGQDALRMLAFRGFEPAFGKIFELIRPDTKTSCSVVRRLGKRVIVSDVETCDFIVGTPALEYHRKTGIRAVQSTPLISRSGHLLGIISTHWHVPHQPAECDLRLMDVLARQAADLMERNQAERTLAESEERFRTLFASAPMAVFVCDRNAVIQHYNRHAVELWGREPVSGVKQHCGSLKLWLPNGTLLPHAQSPIVEVLRTGITALNVEVFIERPDGSRLPVLVNFAPLKNAQGKITGAITSFMDITERKEAETALRESEERFRTLADNLDAQVKLRTVQLEHRNAEVLKKSEQLRDLSYHLIRTQDNERRHIARELHDSAGQILAALGMSLASIARQAMQDAPQLVAAAEDGEQLVQQLSKEIRTMSYLLHPPLLEENGLPEALRWYTEGLKERSGLDILLNVPEDFGRLAPELELVMFRLVQECLTNVHRHSGSQKAAIRITREAAIISLEVQDEGKGIPTERLLEIQSQGSGVGIAGMRERVRQCEGDMSIESNSSGTKICVTFPVPKTATSKLENIVQQVQAAS